MSKAQELLRLKEQMESSRDQLQQLIGAQQQILKTLKERFKVDSIEKGRKLLAQYEQNIAKADQSLTARTNEVKEKFGL